MSLTRLPAVFMRGGTSKALIFDGRDLPEHRADWDDLFLGAMGSPDPYGRQLDGMGGGVTALSKVCILVPSEREDADVDYTFAMVAIARRQVDYKSNCGNMSSAVGPYCVDQGLVRVADGHATVRIHNTNTGKLIHASFPVADGAAVYEGSLAIPGVAGTGAPIKLEFLDPGGANTGRLLPTGNVRDVLTVDGTTVEATLVDAANAAVFVRASDVGLVGTELPDEIAAHPDAMRRLASIRAQACVLMGLAPDEASASQSPVVPYVGFVSAPVRFTTLTGETVEETDADLNIRVIASGAPHKAVPLTISLCAAVAARLEGSILAAAMAPVDPDRAIRLSMPSGILVVEAEVVSHDGQWDVRSGSFYRTARPLFAGTVFGKPMNHD